MGFVKEHIKDKELDFEILVIKREDKDEFEEKIFLHIEPDSMRDYSVSELIEMGKKFIEHGDAIKKKYKL